MHAFCILAVCLLAGEGSPGDLFSLRLSSAGDLDGDSTPDILVSDPVDADRSVCAGRVWAVSGKELRVLHTWQGSKGECLGSTLGCAGDIDKDGVPDLFLGTANDAKTERGSWRLVSGRDGAELYRINGIGYDRRLQEGPAFALVGDVDGDGRSDYVLGEALGSRDERTAAGQPDRRTWGGRITLRSARDGAEIWRIEQPADVELGQEIVAVGDVNGDGLTDVAVTTLPLVNEECVLILSGKDGRTLQSLRWTKAVPERRAAIASGLDLDGDAVQDVVVVMGWDVRRAIAYSGHSGGVIREWVLERSVMYPSVPHMVPDVDADGIPDLVMTAPGSFSDRSSFVLLSGLRDSPPLLDIGFEPWSSTHFACSVLSVPDRDGDGVADLLVGEASQRHHGWLGEARFYSTRTSKLLGSFTRASLEKPAGK